MATRAGRFVEAIKISDTALSRGLSLRGQARMANLSGIARYSSGDLAGAFDAFQRELDIWIELREEALVASAHGNLAEVALHRDDDREAAHHQRACLELAIALGQPAMLAYSCIVAARLAGRRGEWQRAAQLQAAADATLDRIGLTLYDSDRAAAADLVEAARTALGPVTFAAERASGTDLNQLQAARIADEVLASVSDPDSALRKDTA